MCRDGEELVQTGPVNRPGLDALRQRTHHPLGLRVPLGLLAMRIHQDVGIDRDHAPRSE
jgi:hypothetical protein